MLSARLGHFLDRPLRVVASHMGLSPNFLTLAGFVITAAAAAVIPFHLRAGGVLILLGGAFDVLDGVVARVNGRTSRFGAFLDSVLDRFSDAFIFCAVGLHFYLAGDHVNAAVSIAALIGAFGVSYARARAEGLGYECRVGIMERPERIVLLASGCIFEAILVPLLWIVCFGSYVTVVQRIFHVNRHMGAG